jgi:hypothetical protein
VVEMRLMGALTVIPVAAIMAAALARMSAGRR